MKSAGNPNTLDASAKTDVLETQSAAPWEIDPGRHAPPVRRSECDHETRVDKSATCSNRAVVGVSIAKSGIVAVAVFTGVFVAVLAIGLAVKLSRVESPEKIVLKKSDEQEKSTPEAVTEFWQPMDGVSQLETADESPSIVPNEVSIGNRSGNETTSIESSEYEEIDPEINDVKELNAQPALIPSQINAASTKGPMIPMNGPSSGPVIPTVDYRVDFAPFRRGGMPADWKTSGGVAIDWQKGIPALGIMSSGATRNVFQLPAQVGRDFFWEVQLTAATYASIEFAWSSQTSGSALPIVCENNRDAGWIVRYMGPPSRGLRNPYYSTERGTWFYFENRTTGNRPGLYVWTDGVPSSRLRVGDSLSGDFDELRISFSNSHMGSVQNLRWGNLQPEDAKRDALNEGESMQPRSMKFERITPDPLAQNARWVSNLAANESFGSRTVRVECSTAGAVGAQFNLIGLGPTPSLSFNIDFGRGGVLKAPYPGSYDFTNQSHGEYRRGSQMLLLSISKDELGVKFNGRQLYSVPLPDNADFSAVEVDTFGQEVVVGDE